MSQISINFSEVQDTAFEPIPKGEYPVIIDHVEIKASKSSENPYLNWELTVSDGEFINRKLWMMTSLSEKALWRLKSVFSNLGVLEDEMIIETDEDTGYVTNPELAGLPAIAMVTEEIYDGKIRNRVEDLLPGEGSAPKAKAPSLPVKSLPKAGSATAQRPSTPPAKKPSLKLK